MQGFWIGASLAFLGLIASGCSMTRIAANSTVDVFATAAPSFEKESDLELARVSGLANLKVIEGLIEVVPDNTVLLELTAKSYGAYAFGFFEPQLEKMDSLSDEYEALAGRAVNFYNRGKSYASAAMEEEYPGFTEALEGPLSAYETLLAQVEKEHVSTLFWVGFNLGSAINLQLEDPASVVDLPKVMATMERVIQLDETTYFGNAHVILGVAKAALPKALGGDPDGAKEHFLQAQRLTDGKYIMTDFLYARFYLAQAVQDEDGFTETLEAILEAEDDTFPEQRLAQEIAKVRAQYWLDHTDELF